MKTNRNFMKSLLQGRKKPIAIIAFILAILSIDYVFAQQVTVSGVVQSQSGEKLEGVSVSVVNANMGTSTDVDGVFNISAAVQDSLLFSSIGYKPQTLYVGKNRILTVVLVVEGSTLDEVAVVGYGTQRKITLTGAQSTISLREVSKVSTPSISNAIAGKMPGIITRQASGEPGADAAQVFIRGLATFGNNAPLILIDGVERDMNQINAQEIESFTILKDASATAVYGVRGANGVILINTKRGVIGKPAISFRSEAASLEAMRLPRYITGGDYASLMNEAYRYAGETERWTPEEIAKFYDHSDPYFYPNVDWTSTVLNKYTWQTINNLSVVGGTDIIKYYTNVGYTLQNGIFKQDPKNKYNSNANIKRYNFRSNIDIDLAKNLTMQLGLGGIISNRNMPGVSSDYIFNRMSIISPISYPVLNPDGTPAGAATYVGDNPWGLVSQSGYSTEDRSTLQGTFAGRWDLSSLVTKGLSLRGLFSYDRYARTSNARRKEYEVKRFTGIDPATEELNYNVFREEKPLGYSIANAANRAMYMEGQLNYEKSFGNHYLTSMLLYNQRDYVDLTASSSISNLPYRKQGVSGRVNYAFKDKYLAEVNFGYNGSENFPKGRRFGFFPAFSAGWVVSQEAFWKVEAMNHFKIRASHGKVGNDQIGQRFLFLNTINTTGQSYYFGDDQQLYYGMEENQIGNDRVTWERSTKNNIGVDFGFFGDRLTLQMDIFNKHRAGILLRRETVPDVAGFFPWSIPYANIGVMKNKGFDALLEARNSTASGWMYTFRGNFTFARNEIVENDEPARRYAYMSSRGRALNTNMVYVAEGFFASKEEIDASPRQKFTTDVRPGDVKYRDINGDGQIDAFDRIFVGYPRLPEMSFGFGGTVAYKWIDFSVYLTGAANSSLLLNGYSMWPFYDGDGVNNVLQEYYDNRWTPDNPDAKYPAIDRGNNPNNFTNSTIWMKNGNYLRLRNAEIGFNMPESVTRKLHVKNLRLFVNGMNLYTWDHIKVIDPESNDGVGRYPLQRSFNAGLQIDFN